MLQREGGLVNVPVKRREALTSTLEQMKSVILGVIFGFEKKQRRLVVTLYMATPFYLRPRYPSTPELASELQWPG